MHIKLLLAHFLTITMLALTGCGSTSTVNENTQQIIARAEAPTYEVVPNSQLLLSSIHSTIDDAKEVNYAWLDGNDTLLSSESTYLWTAPTTEGDYTIELVLNDDKGHESSSDITITVKQDLSLVDPTFQTIQKMISQSKTGALSDVTYIMIGDSTRVYTNYNGVINHCEKIFNTVDSALEDYNVTSHLVAQGGLAMKTFLGGHYDENDTVTWKNIQEAIDFIPNDGTTTIVDISLGANDFSRLNEYYQAISGWEPERIHDILKTTMNEMIDTLLDAKPNIHIMLTSPNPMKEWEGGAKVYQDVYKEVASERNFPFANFVDDIMPTHYTDDFNAWYNDNIHFNETVGLPAVSSFILEKILP